jgi:RNA-binding protein YlmH
LLNLGVDRSKIGDILVQENSAIVFVHKSIESFMLDEVTRIRHTMVQTSIVDMLDISFQPETKEIKGSVSSIRLDSLMALAFSSSRSKLVEFIENGKVFVNGKLITSNGYQLKENDIISVRGLGRFRFIETLSETKKGRLYVNIHLYI